MDVTQADVIDPRLLLKSLRAFKNGDFSVRLPTDQIGIAGEIADAFNETVKMAAGLTDEMERMSTVVGQEGRTSQRSKLRNAQGSWADGIDSLNNLISDLTQPLNDLEQVLKALSSGHFTTMMPLEIEGIARRGRFKNLAESINSLATQLNEFADEVQRMTRQVGIEGELGTQVELRSASGSFQELSQNLNMMLANLANQVRNIAAVSTAITQGDLTRLVTTPAKGEMLFLKNTINNLVGRLARLADEINRVLRQIGVEGQLGGQVDVWGIAGTWRELVNNVNLMSENLTEQMRHITAVTTAVALGDLSVQVTAPAKGEMLVIKNSINTMVTQLDRFTEEVFRLTYEVGVEGKLGGRANVIGASGRWRDLTDNVNLMATNLTEQVRKISEVMTAVVHGNLNKKLQLQARGEIAALANTINEMIETLEIFSKEVTRITREISGQGKLGGQVDVPGATGVWRDLTKNFNRLTRNLARQARAVNEVATAVTEGDLSREITIRAVGDVAVIKEKLNAMIHSLRETMRFNTEQVWLKTSLTHVTRMLQGQRDLTSVANMILRELASLLPVQHALFYLRDGAQDATIFQLIASYAYRERKHLANRFALGEGLVGQSALEKQRILLTQVPGDYIQINSGLGEAPPLNIVVQPIQFEGVVLAIVELASFERFSDVHLSFLERLAESIGIVTSSISATMRTEELLKESQAMAEELQAQQDQLAQANAELEERTELLKEKQDQLEQSNIKLEEKTKLLMRQNEEVERKNREIEEARSELEEKAIELEKISKYKSEFLTNISHELRTPLNSMLILAQLLAENRKNNLSQKQVEYAETIYASGTDLLGLITDILDLAKIESGSSTVELNQVGIIELVNHLERSFRQIAQGKKLEFTINIDQQLPSMLYTDGKRLQQILRNLLANSFKFTAIGQISLNIKEAHSGWSRSQETLNQANLVIAFEVSDTGIGIPLDKQAVIFEAFQQVDGTISRHYGGTGLGLAISREMARLIEGELCLTFSSPNKGSTFTFYLPQKLSQSESPLLLRPARSGRIDTRPLTSTSDVIEQPSNSLDGHAERKEEEPAESHRLNWVEQQELIDDREHILPGDPVLLIVEDDIHFAHILRDLAHERSFKVLISTRGDMGLVMARQYQPDAITLDIQLPSMNGWAVLDLLKHDPDTRHIPVHIISVEEERLRGLEQGAIGMLTKPVSATDLKQMLDHLMAFQRRSKSLLIIEDDTVQRRGIVELIGGQDIETTAVGTAEEALEALNSETFDCIVLDLHLPDMDGFTLLNHITSLGETPVIVYTGQKLTKPEETQLRKLAQTIIIKGARSPERLLDETALFLHRVEKNLSDPKRKMLQKAQQNDPILAGKKVLIVDDDIRNLFALTSVLEQQNMDVVYAENGKEGIAELEKETDIDVILMDIMMPQMDGYEAMRLIRQDSRFKSLPIIALTAKAMKEDREKCIEAGASDYISKPVENEQLLSLLRVWLYE
jgi:CheY-like chemotaxis protein/signal transduction histidine kinase